MRLVDQLARVDEKVDSFCKQYGLDISSAKNLAQEASKRVDRLETKYDEILQKYSDLVVQFNELKTKYEKTKWIWAAITVILTPIVTTIIIFLIDKCFNGLPW